MEASTRTYRIDRVSGFIRRGDDRLGGTVNFINMFHTQIALEFYTVVDRGAVAVGTAELLRGCLARAASTASPLPYLRSRASMI